MINQFHSAIAGQFFPGELVVTLNAEDGEKTVHPFNSLDELSDVIYKEKSYWQTDPRKAGIIREQLIDLYNMFVYRRMVSDNHSVFRELSEELDSVSYEFRPIS